MADLSAREVEKVEFAFSIYDADGSNNIDCMDLGNVLRALNLNPTNATIEKLGGTKKRGEKLMKLDEFLPIYSQCKKDKEQGCYEDFLECLKLYDKQENGTMLAAELSHTLLALGERLEDTQVEEVLKDCMDAEDEDGFIPYALYRTQRFNMAGMLKSITCFSYSNTYKSFRVIHTRAFLRRLCERAAAEGDE